MTPSSPSIQSTIAQLVARVEALERQLAPDPQLAHAQSIIASVAAAYCVSARDLQHTRRRSERIAWPRMVCYYLIRKHTRLSLPEIGKLFHRLSSAVSHGITAVANRLAVYPETRATVEHLLSLAARRDPSISSTPSTPST